MGEPMPPVMAARLLRSKAAELENRVLILHQKHADPDLWVLTADVALVAQLLAELIERVSNIAGRAELREEG